VSLLLKQFEDIQTISTQLSFAPKQGLSRGGKTEPAVYYEDCYLSSDYYLI